MKFSPLLLRKGVAKPSAACCLFSFVFAELGSPPLSTPSLFFLVKAVSSIHFFLNFLLLCSSDFFAFAKSSLSGWRLNPEKPNLAIEISRPGNFKPKTGPGWVLSRH
eukprot:TRINITY_DN16243_c0_g1_i1.p1 TRINITY_DN16243_c0_g1~~TRINITY_DN16243_c0_g1_i1.p1  ORF type:complete len:107 (-),score=11.64 TRINITY_DN16243_c0_g1_i1:85-405(-)